MGEVGSTAELLEGSRRAGSASLHYASAATLVMLSSDAHVDTAHRMMVSAIEGSLDRGDADDAELVNGLATLLQICFFGGRSELWKPLYDALGRLSHEPPPSLTLTVDLFADPARTGVAALPRLLAALQGHHDETLVQGHAAAAWYPDRLAELRDLLWRAVLNGREGGPARRHLLALMDICVDDFHRGRWDEAADLAAEGLALTEEGGRPILRLVLPLSPGAAGRGQGQVRDEPGAGRADDRLGRSARRRHGTGLRSPRPRPRRPRPRRLRERVPTTRPRSVPAGTLASHVPHALWIAMDLVEAAVRTDRRAEAERHVRALQDARQQALTQTGDPRRGLRGHGGRGR